MGAPKNSSNYELIARAITYIIGKRKQRPSLKMIADHINISLLDFECLISNWADSSPTQFLQYLHIEHVKSIMYDCTSTAGIASHSDISNMLRLHEQFVEIEAMSPSEYMDSGINLEIFYSIQVSPFGAILIASTSKGICYLSFLDDRYEPVQELHKQFPKAQLREEETYIHQEVLKLFDKKTTTVNPIKLHLYGTPFQVKVWKSLLRIPNGTLCTYGDLAKIVGSPKASRAVGTAIGSITLPFSYHAIE